MSAAISLVPADAERSPMEWAGLARAQIAACEDISEAQEMAAQASAVLAYLAEKLGRASEEARAAAEVELLVRRRIGELLPAPRPSGTPGPGRGKRSEPRTVLDKRRVSEARALAEVPEPVLRDYIAEKVEAGEPPTVSGALAQAKKLRRQEHVHEVRSRGSDNREAVESLDQIVAAVEAGERAAFGTVYLDPPWRYGNQGTRGATDNHYQTMAVDEIAAMPVGQLAAEQSHLHLWTTSVFLPDALKLIDCWGFAYKGYLVWIKEGRFGLGNYWRGPCEILLLGVRGGQQFLDHGIRGDFASKPGRHSAKPDGIRQLIERVSPGPRIELFARQTFDGWVSWGNEIDRTLFNEQAFA